MYVAGEGDGAMRETKRRSAMEDLNDDAAPKVGGAAGLFEVMVELSDDAELRALMAKAEIVKYSVRPDCVVVWTQDHEWQVRRSKKDGNVYCTCPAWRFRKDKSTTCKHCIAVLNAGIEVPEYQGVKKIKVFGVSLGTGNGEEGAGA